MKTPDYWRFQQIVPYCHLLATGISIIILVKWMNQVEILSILIDRRYLYPHETFLLQK